MPSCRETRLCLLRCMLWLWYSCRVRQCCGSWCCTKKPITFQPLRAESFCVCVRLLLACNKSCRYFDGILNTSYWLTMSHDQFLLADDESRIVNCNWWDVCMLMTFASLDTDWYSNLCCSCSATCHTMYSAADIASYLHYSPYNVRCSYTTPLLLLCLP